MNKSVAITGLSFRFPGTDYGRYWQDLLDGKDLVTKVSADRWVQESLVHPDQKHPGTSYTFAAGSLGDVATFDTGFFGISPREAARMDPQQRLLLEMGWEALENSGIRPSSLRGSNCGVYIGIASADYSYRLADDLAAVDSSIATGNTASIAANRISYFFDLHGPSMAIDTACSSSLVAFHQACRSILSGECTQAFAGGISLHLHPYGFLTFSKASMLSRQGRCRVFDAAGDGYVRSEGGGVLFLKDYDQAVKDGNPILAVVAHSSINMDGHKTGLTVPNTKAQTALLQKAYHDAGIKPEEIDYLEAHGTGTAVGDPVEAEAIGTALGKFRLAADPLPIGSVKSNMGHLETASGVAGLVKALYCIRHRLVPATIGFENPNPSINFKELNIEVVAQNRPLKKTGKVIIGINSFGFGGANAHVILESHEPTENKPAQWMTDKALPIMLSARDEVGLKATAKDFSDYLDDKRPTDLYNIAYNTAFGRDAHKHRLIVYGSTPGEIAGVLGTFAAGRSENSLLETATALQDPLGPVFIYSGNGSQWAGMGEQLLAEDPLFRVTVEEIDRLFLRHADFSLVDELTGKNGRDRYAYTEIAQPALFAVQVGMTQMLRSRGLQPIAVAGHSVGEIAAAWVAGGLTLEDAVEVIYHRSRLQGKTKGKGGMTAVGLGHEAALQVLAELDCGPGLTIAGVNSSRGVTIAGETALLTQLETVLTDRKIFQRRLEIDYAFHSQAMDEIEASVKKALAHITSRQTTLPFYSTTTGKLLAGNDLNAEYWWNNIYKPVLFDQAIKSILAEGMNIFIEIGPNPILRSYINTCLKEKNMEGRILPTAAAGKNSPQRVWRAGSQAILAGAKCTWQDIFSIPGRFMQLPNYPWQRERHWLKATAESFGLLDRRKEHPLLGYPLHQQELTWENQLDTTSQPSLADHIVGEATVFPGTGFSELILAAALAWQPENSAEIEGLEIHSPLLLDKETTRLVRLRIDPHDGSVTVKGRKYCSAEPWTLHATARILAEPQEILLQQQLPALPDRAVDFTSADHQLLTRRVGLAYGPAFQCIDHGWVDKDTALTVFNMPESILSELDHSWLHPAILDCTFQLILQLLKEQIDLHENIVFVPTRMGRIAFRKSADRPAFAQAVLLRRAPHSLTAEFAVFDGSGVCIATVKDARFRSMRLGKKNRESLRFLDYHSVPCPHAITPEHTPIVSFSSFQSVFAEITKSAATTQAHQRFTGEVDPLLDILCRKFTTEALQQIATDDRHLTSSEIQNYRTAAPEVAPFLDYLLSAAKYDQSITHTSEGWDILPDDDDQISAQDIWNSLIVDYPEFLDIIHSVGRVGMHLKSLFKGATKPTQIKAQDCTPAQLTDLVFTAVARQKCGEALCELIAQGFNQLPEGRRLGIIEIFHGKPTFAPDICRAMDFDRGNYIIAGTSIDTMKATSELQERYPRITTCLFGKETEQVQEEVPTIPGCEIAIVTLDFPSLDATLDALQYARTALVPGGTLLVRGQNPTRWLDFIFGPQVNHGSRTQHSNRLADMLPVLPASYWQQQLHQLNFIDGTVVELCPDSPSGAYILLARAAERALPVGPAKSGLPRSWVILADRTGYSAALSDLLTTILQKKSDIVIQAPPGDTVANTLLLQETTAAYGNLDGIIDLAGLSPQTVAMSAEDVLEDQVDRCAFTAGIVRACEASETSTSLWLITTNAVTDLLPARNPDPRRPRPIIAKDAALWGFGRTLINEAAGLRVRLVDLENALALETVAMALARELDQTDDEQEIILTAGGERYAPRLAVARDQQRNNTGSDTGEQQTISLGFQFPGRLRNLRWQSSPRILPAEDEIEVEVHATGLNFRDIMYTLGLLPDEAVENGFAGPTLGLEFSGVVQCIGGKNSIFAPGDRVVGFGPSSFGNRVVTKATAIAHMPPEISFAAATTIPSTFFTAYYALHYLARLQAGERVLIHGAAGGVGLAAIQVAKWLGAEIYTTAGSDEKQDFLRLLGIEHILHSRSLSFADEILAQTNGQGVDVVLNSLAGEAVNRNLRVLKPFGRFLELGKRDFYENTKIGLRPFRNNISYFGIDADQLMQNRPKLTGRLFTEVMTLFAQGTFHPLPYRIFEAENIVDAFRYMQQARQIGKIVITYQKGISHVQPDVSPKKQLQLKGDATYLVTGGLAGFGLRTAEWLAEKGAGHLVLLSRSGPGSIEANTAIERLQHHGVKVYAASCDITDKKALERLLAATARKMPPLKGIVHAANVIDDGLIRNMDAKQIRRVLAPKALGAYYLHELTLDLSLDYFILFSSATTLFGNPGQGNYVAANACLDALACNRRNNGLPATCVRWGAIDDVGFLARNVKIKDALQNRMGGAAIDSTIALEVLEEMLVSGRTGQGVMEIDWQALSRFLPSAGSPKFQEISRNFRASGNDMDTTDDMHYLLEELSDEELLAAIVAILKDEAGEILQISPSKMDPESSMYEMGLDSLMGVELVVALESRFGTRLSVMALSQSPTIDKLAELIFQQLKGSEAKDETPTENEILSQAKKLAAQHGAEISDETITKLAENLQSRDTTADDHIIH